MAKEWIENLTAQIKNKHREPAEEFSREQHRADVIGVQGRIFFGDMVRALDDNFTQIKKLLQADPTSADIAMISTGTTQVHLTRSRFPWFDAHLTHDNEDITLEYAKTDAIPVDPANAEKKTIVFDIHVSDDDKLSFEDASVDPAQMFETPEDLARRVTEILFAV
jgi:hypothetical protein